MKWKTMLDVLARQEITRTTKKLLNNFSPERPLRLLISQKDRKQYS